MMAGGLFNVKLGCHGLIAITAHYEPLTLPVNASTGPVFTDPMPPWHGRAACRRHRHRHQLRTFIGRGSAKASSCASRAKVGWWCSLTRKWCANSSNEQRGLLDDQSRERRRRHPCLLVGDALGVPYEFSSPEALPPISSIEMSPPTGFRQLTRASGTWSDDGSQALCLGTSDIDRT